MKIRKIDNGRAEVKMYGQIGTWFQSGDEFSEMLSEVEAAGHKDLTIRMHCYGGSVIEGNVIYNALQRSKLNITIVIDGVAASMGCFILPAIENVEICDNAFGMIHRPSSYATGNADDLRNNAKLLDNMEQNFAKRMAERTGMSEADVRKKWLDGGNHWLTASEMVQYGFAKKIVPATAKSTKELDKEIVATMGVENVFARFAAQLQIPTNLKIDKMNVNALIAAFALEGVTAESSEADVLKALQGKFTALENKIREMENAATARVEAEINALLGAQAKGSYTDAELAELKEIGLKAGVKALAVALKKTSAQPVSIVDLIKGEGKPGAGTGTKTWKWYQENDPTALEKMPESDPETFKQLYKAEYGMDI